MWCNKNEREKLLNFLCAEWIVVLLTNYHFRRMEAKGTKAMSGRKRQGDKKENGEAREAGWQEKDFFKTSWRLAKKTHNFEICMLFLH